MTKPGLISHSCVSFAELLVLILQCCIVVVVVVVVCMSEPNLAASPSSCSTVRRSNWFRQCERTDTQTPSVLLPSLPHSVVSLTRPSTFSPTKEEEKHPPSLLHHSLALLNHHGTEMQNTRVFTALQFWGLWVYFLMNSLTWTTLYSILCFSFMYIESAHFWVTEMGPKSINAVLDEAAVMSGCLMLYIFTF